MGNRVIKASPIVGHYIAADFLKNKVINDGNRYLLTKKGSDFFKKYIAVDHSNTLVYTDNPFNYFYHNLNVYKVTKNGIIHFNKYNPSFMHTPAYYNEEIIKNNSLDTKHKYKVNFKNLVNNGKTIFFLFLIMILSVLLIISFSN